MATSTSPVSSAAPPSVPFASDEPFARRFSDMLDSWRQAPPAVGTAALAGRSPNPQLFRAFKALSDAHISLARGAISYRWRPLHEADPQLAQSIEEVLVFGDALFSAWGRRTPPENLKNRYIDVKQRYAKIIKETEILASPNSLEEESRLSRVFAFGGLNKILGLKKEDQLLVAPAAPAASARRRRNSATALQAMRLPPSGGPTGESARRETEETPAAPALTKEEQRVERRLDNLDVLLQQAHQESRLLLDEAEMDLQGEQAFHKATEWFVLAVERARLSLERARSEDGSLSGIGDQVLDDLDRALLASSGTTSVILSTTEQWLRLKEALHNKSITFLATHENTFTVIQGHLRAWRDIKVQQEALNALSQAVAAGSSLMTSASNGVEEPVKQWSGDFITPEAMAALTRSFSAYDESIAQDIAALAQEGPGTGVRVSPWDDWDTTRKALIVPLLAALPPVASPSLAERPTLRRAPEGAPSPSVPSLPAPAPAAALVEPLSVADEHAAPPSSSGATSGASSPSGRPSSAPWPLHADRIAWSPLDRKMVDEARDTLSSALNVELPIEKLEARRRSAAETLMRLKALWSYRPVASASDWTDLHNESQAWRARVLEHVLEADTNDVLDDQVWSDLSRHAPREVGSPSWLHEINHWMASRDDLEWATVMRWNDLVLDCLILEQDPVQRADVLSATTPDHPSARIRASLSERLGAFLENPALPMEAVASWGFAPLLVRYACALDVGHAAEAVALLEATGSIRQPIDWDGRAVNRWGIDHPDDMSTPTAAVFLTERALHLAGLGLSADGVLGRPEEYPLPRPNDASVPVPSWEDHPSVAPTVIPAPESGRPSPSALETRPTRRRHIKI